MHYTSKGTVQKVMSNVCSCSWHSHVRSSSKDTLNSGVLPGVEVFLAHASSAFQACAAAAGSVRSLPVARHVNDMQERFTRILHKMH